MAERVTAGPIPDDLDVRLQRRDTSPLPPWALLRFQVINRGKGPWANYRWVLAQDGRWFLARHSGADHDWQVPFDTDLPTTPTKQVPASVVADVEARLRQADFLRQPHYHVDPTVQDGLYSVVTARLDNREHEVIYNAVYPPLVEFLREIIAKHG